MKSFIISKEKTLFVLFFILMPIILFFIFVLPNYYNNLLYTTSHIESGRINVVEKKLYKELNQVVNSIENKVNLLESAHSEPEMISHSKTIFHDLNYLYGGIRKLSLLEHGGVEFFAILGAEPLNWSVDTAFRSDSINRGNIPRFFNQDIIISHLKQYKQIPYISLYIPIHANKQYYLSIDIEMNSTLSKVFPDNKTDYLVLNNQHRPIALSKNSNLYSIHDIEEMIHKIELNKEYYFLQTDNPLSIKLGVYNHLDSFDIDIISFIDLKPLIVQFILEKIVPFLVFVVFYIMIGMFFMERIFNVPGILTKYLTNLKINLSTTLTCFSNVRYLKFQLPKYRLSHEKFLDNYNHIVTGAIIYENTSDGILITDADHKIISVNNSFTDITGYSEKEVLGKSPAFLKSGRHTTNFYKALWRSIKHTGSWQGEIWNKRKNGEVFQELLTINTIRDNDGNITHHMGVFSDISEVTIKDEQLEHLAFHDPLTHLPNRLKLKERLNQELICSKNNHTTVAVLFIDLDGFKAINDQYGHDFGDQLLTMVVSRLQHSKRKQDFLARLGGDEFVLVINSVTDEQMIAHIAKNIIDNMLMPFHIEREQIKISSSIGISLYPEGASDIQTLLKQADDAMYQAKAAGRSKFVFFKKLTTS